MPAAGHGLLETTHADREHVIGILKAAFVQGRLTKDEFDDRLGQTFASRACAELAPITADIPAGLTAGQPPEPARAQDRWPVNISVRSGVCMVLVAFILTSLIVAGGLTGAGPDARACRAFSSWAGPAPHGIWLLDAAVAAAQQGSNRNLLNDLQDLRRLVRQSGGSAPPSPPGSVQDPGQSQVENATVLVSADCRAYNY
jgi:hypothetical protein